MLVHRADNGLRDVWFGCRSGAGTITFGFLVRQRPPETLMDKEWFLRHRLDEPALLVATVKSGRASAKQPSVPFAEQGGAGFNLTLRLDHPVVRQVSRTGRIELEAFGERRAPPPVPLTNLRALLDACREP